jgi:hypothetical protein
MTLIRISNIILLVAISGLFACTNDTPVSIVGKWELVEGFRSGKKTESLADTYFKFSPNGEMETNLGGSTETVNYQLEGRTISQDSERFPVAYSIDEIADSTLVLSMEMKNIPFKFVLRKVAVEEVQ